MTTDLVLLQIILCVLFVYIFLPLSVIFIMRVIRARNALILKKRFVNASIWGCIALCCWLYLSQPLNHFQHLFESNSFSWKLCNFISHIIYTFSAQGAVYSLTFRFWMIHFEFVYAESLKNEQWKLQINPKGCSDDELWIINHRKTFGNPQWIFIRLFTVYISVALIISILFSLAIFEIIEYDLASLTDTACYLIPLFTIFILWKKMPSFLDNFMVKNELRWIVIAYGVALIWNLIFVIFLTVNPNFSEESKALIWTFPVLFVCFTTIFIQTQYIFMQIKKNTHYFGNILSNYHGMYDKEFSFSGSSLNDNIHRRVKKETHSVNLCEILQDPISFSLFIQHLNTELSTECLFSFIEFTQFRHLLENNQDFMSKINEYIEENENDIVIITNKSTKLGSIHTVSHSSINKYNTLQLLDERYIPLSHIVYIKQYNTKNIIDGYKYIILELTAKYIDDSADFCINIGYQTRLNIMNWIYKYCNHDHIDNDNKNETEVEIKQLYEMYNLFEKCRKEMFNLMNHIAERFVKTHAFQKFKQS